jgi:hypothetical protein
MAVHFPSELNVFAAVCMDNPVSAIKDKGLLSAIRSKLERYDERFGQFIGSAEDPKMFKVVLDLEQMIGREITWVRGESFEVMVNRKKALPNQEWRFCTTEMKMRPIAGWIYYHNEGQKVLNCVGIRIDEAQRVKTEGHRSQSIDIQVGNHKSGKKKWLNFEFAEATYPLIFDADGNYAPIKKSEIYGWAEKSGLDFPISSNCQFCFHKGIAELIQNQQRHPDIFQSAEDMETAYGNGTMKKDVPIAKIKTMQKPAPQLSFWGGESCESTFCTD